LIWVDLAAVNVDAGQPVRAVNPDDISLAGNVIDKLQQIKAPF